MEQEGAISLIDQFFLVAIKKEANAYSSYIQYCHPSELSKSSERVPLFCFPEGISQLANVNNAKNQLNLTFTFVFTGEMGKQQYGFCRRIQSFKRKSVEYGDGAANDNVTSIISLCILSSHDWFSFHDQLLEIVEERYMVSLECVAEFVTSILYYPFPVKERYFTIEVSARSNGILPSEYEFVKPDKFTNMHLKPLFDTMLVGNILCLFASLLFERRIIVHSNNLSKLSCCVHAAVSLLYPLKWYYIYIPILPNVLLDYCMAPMPFIAGVHSSVVRTLKGMPTEQIVFVDLDDKNVELPKEDFKLLPDTSKLRQNLEFQLLQSRKADQFSDRAITECFRQWFLQIFGNYIQFIKKDSNGLVAFAKDEFIRMSAKNNQKFLEAFSISQMFERFMADCEAKGPIQNIFEKEIIKEIAKQDIIDKLNVYKAIGSEKAMVFSEKASQQFSHFSDKASLKAHQQLSHLSAKASQTAEKAKKEFVHRTGTISVNGRANVTKPLPPPLPPKKPMSLPIVEEAQLIDLDLDAPKLNKSQSVETVNKPFLAMNLVDSHSKSLSDFGNLSTGTKLGHSSLLNNSFDLLDSEIPETPALSLALLHPQQPLTKPLLSTQNEEILVFHGYTPTQHTQADSNQDPFSIFF